VGKMNVLLLVGIILAILFILVGGILLIVALVSRSKAKTAQNWPAVTGTVISAQVQEHKNVDIEDSQTMVNYSPVVQYTYSVMGMTYTSTRVGYGANQFDRKTAQRKVEQYPAGSAVTVHYDPSNPQSSVLEVQAAGSKVFLIIGIVLIVLGVMACCFSGVIGLINMMASQ
jgi:hypothetical protein